MQNFAIMALVLLKQSLVLAAGVMLVGSLILMSVYQNYRETRGVTAEFPWKKSILILLLAGYGAIVLYVTLLRGPGGEYRYVNIHLFEAWRQAWSAVSPRGWINILINIILFIPLGLLLPQISEFFERWSFTMTIGLAVSLVIELLQLITGTGIFDIDDLSANFLGNALGFCIVKSLYSFSGRNAEKRRWGVVWLLPPVAFLLIILGGGFYYYEQECKAASPEDGELIQAYRLNDNAKTVHPSAVWTEEDHAQLRNISQSVADMKF